MPKLSVIMPVYNTSEEHLRSAIESILAQTFSDFEFLIIDDGSENNAVDVIKSYSDARIRLILNEKNKGLIFTLNRAMDEAKGEFIARMDSDDISYSERFEEQLGYLEQNPDVALLGSSIQYFDSSKRTVLAPEGFENIKFIMLFENPIAHPSVMFRACEFKDLRYDENFKHAEDYELWTRALSLGLKFENLPKILLKYRIHKNQVGKKHNGIQTKSAISARKAYIRKIFPLSEREVDLLINLTNEHKKLFMAAPKEYEALLKKVIKTNVKKKFFNSRQLLTWISDVTQEIKYPKIRLFSLKLGKKFTLSLAHPKSTFKNEKKVFNFLFALSVDS